MIVSVTPKPKLSNATWAALPGSIVRPTYDRSAVGVGIIHFGVGAFHRAHQAVYTDDVLETGDLRWGIGGVALRRPDMRNTLSPQDGLYTLAVRHHDGTERLRIVGSIKRMLFAPDSPARIVEALALPSVAIVSLTVTEKGYCRNPLTGELDAGHPDIVHDLASPYSPRSAVGLLAAATAARRMRGLKPLTLLSCDNLNGNGRALRKVLSAYLQLVFPGMVSYSEDMVACPNTVVDRIVPEASDSDRQRVTRALGVVDQAPVITEEYTQWVIEDRFSAERPAWEAVGARLVADTRPFETLKLRLINGTHSAIAYLGYLGGYETIAEALGDGSILRFARRLMEDTAVTLGQSPAGIDVDDYGASILGRFASRGLRHPTRQVAMDGSQKLPERLLATAYDRLSRGLDADRHALVVAAWMRYVAGTDEQGRPIDVRDPLVVELTRSVKDAGSDRRKLAAVLLDEERIFDRRLACHPGFREAVSFALETLWIRGSRATAAAYAGGNRQSPRSEAP